MAEFLTLIISSENILSFWRDNKGGLVLPFSGHAVNDEDWLEYKGLKIDKTVKSINRKDLPGDFCGEACELVDEFRRKTVNLSDEWMLYFDYKTGEVIYCFKGQGGKCGGNYEKLNFEDRDIASVHSHINDYYSFPSQSNFEILEKDFEDYEIICSLNAVWIIESKGISSVYQRDKINSDTRRIYETIDRYVKVNFNDIDVASMIEELYSHYLLNYLNNNYDNIKIRKKEY